MGYTTPTQSPSSNKTNTECAEKPLNV